MYGDGTLFSQNAWFSCPQYAAPRGSGVLDPMRTIRTLILEVSSFSTLLVQSKMRPICSGRSVYRLFEQIEAIPQNITSADPAIIALACHGTQIHQRIRNWHETIGSHLNHDDPYAQLAIANYHALELFHCRNFTFNSCWDNAAVPFLTQSEINAHVTSILHLCERSLENSAIPGVILLFPLRMAGANALKTEHRAELVEILDRIYRSGFVVSDRIKVDVQELWQVLAR